MTTLQRQPKPEVSAVAWELSGELTFEQWKRYGEQLGVIGRGHQWWIGDWLNYGESRYGQKYAQARKITGIPTATLENYAWIADEFESSRRREHLTWTHHREIAGLDRDGQDDMLDLAAAHGWSTDKLRTEVAALKRIDAAAAAPSTANGRALSEPAPASEPAVVDAHSITCPSCGHEFTTYSPGVEG